MPKTTVMTFDWKDLRGNAYNTLHAGLATIGVHLYDITTFEDSVSLLASTEELTIEQAMAAYADHLAMED